MSFWTWVELQQCTSLSSVIFSKYLHNNIKLWSCVQLQYLFLYHYEKEKDSFKKEEQSSETQIKNIV